MAESSLSIDLNTLRQEVGMRHGWGRTVANFGATKLADFDRISKRALREFYFPALDISVPPYEWSWLRKSAQITLVTDDKDYTLPDDFSGTILDDSVTYAPGINHPHLAKISPFQIRQLWSGESVDRDWPAYFAVRNQNHNAATGQRWEMLVSPIPGATQNTAILDYRYVFLPDALSNSAPYPVGGANHSEVILAAHLAAAELVLDGDPVGPQRQNFITLLASSVRADLQQKDNAGGGTA